MVLHTIELDVNIALRKIKKLSYQNLDGKHLDIRKNPHAIDVVLGLNMLYSY
jgi:hypothetical protein